MVGVPYRGACGCAHEERRTYLEVSQLTGALTPAFLTAFWLVSLCDDAWPTVPVAMVPFLFMKSFVTETTQLNWRFNYTSRNIFMISTNSKTPKQ